MQACTSGFTHSPIRCPSVNARAHSARTTGSALCLSVVPVVVPQCVLFVGRCWSGWTSCAPSAKRCRSPPPPPSRRSTTNHGYSPTLFALRDCASLCAWSFTEAGRGVGSQQTAADAAAVHARPRRCALCLCACYCCVCGSLAQVYAGIPVQQAADRNKAKKKCNLQCLVLWFMIKH